MALAAGGYNLGVSDSASRVDAGTIATFHTSLTPMVLADDRRHYVDVNQAMCLLLRSDRTTVLQMTIDDLTPAELRGGMQQAWDTFVAEGIQSGTFELQMPDGPRMYVDYSATADVRPGQHLAIFVVPATRGGEVAPRAEPRQLTAREREVLTMVAMGESGTMIGRVLGISRATVETHVRSCLTKLEARNRAHAIALGLRGGEIAMEFDAPTR